MAAVPVTSCVFDLGCSQGRHTVPLLRLGFPVHGCDPYDDAVTATRRAVADLLGDDGDPEQCVRQASLDDLDYPDDSFDWVVAYHAERFASTGDELIRLLHAARRLLKPGGWVYVTVPASAEAVTGHAQTQGDGAPATDPAAVSDATDVTLDDVRDGATFSVDTLEAARSDAGLAESVAATLVREHGEARLRAIYRRVDGARS